MYAVAVHDNSSTNHQTENDSNHTTSVKVEYSTRVEWINVCTEYMYMGSMCIYKYIYIYLKNKNQCILCTFCKT